MATTTRTQHAPTRTVTLARVLLHRRATVYVPPTGDPINVAAEPGIALLEADLADRGWLLSVGLRAALTRLDTPDLAAFGSALLADCDDLVGGDRDHTPLFRRFPDRVPHNTLGLYVDRILAAWFQMMALPCVLCFAAGTVRPVNPCAHLVCTDCFQAADYSACPICYRALDRDDPFLTAGQPADEPAVRRPVDAAGPTRLRVLHRGSDMPADARAELLGLLARPGALPPGEVDDLGVLLAAQDRTDLTWLPATVPGRETKARLLSWLLDEPTPATLDKVTDLLDTATDVLRLLVARSGGESLIDRPRLAPVARPLRRALLAALDRITVPQLVEDMRRHRGAWIAVGERLHPGEHAHRWPRIATAFTALRGTDLDRHPAGEAIEWVASSFPGVRIAGQRVRVAHRAARVEQALADGNAMTAVANLTSRPGELLRRADHLLRLAGRADGDAVIHAIGRAAEQAAPAVVLSTLGEIRTRHEDRQRRVFFPAGRTGTAHVIADERPRLPLLTVGQTVGVLGDAILTRAAALPPVDRAVIDRALDKVIAPFAERTASRALVTLARGSVLPIPDGRVVRLFTHWMESDERVDLDLSVAVYDDQWRHVGTCDYTSLRLPGATHSGDFTSAPAPRGASEFIDLDVPTLAAGGGRWAVVSVLSYNNVPFTGMAEAFAGFMVRDQTAEHGSGARSPFDARQVEQRFDLAGPGKVTIPMVVDLQSRTMRWLDVAARVTGTNHAVHRHHHQFAEVASALVESFEAGGRVTLGELGRYLAAARAREVLVRDGDGLRLLRRGEGESVKAFHARLRDEPGEPATVEDAASAGLQFVGRGDLPVPDGAEVYALHPAGLDASRVRLLAAADVAGLLA
ncbi:MXAN_6230/SCO0854 family RING domain-containing protein [Micromonospora sp. NPDC006766]|uniref:MXAN_6230/SCO0854 family RING domain-containing protein n=1 Tax=Micromonospora sp. NPDC006766 TaxID=3154778 RepID=UPI0033D188AC